MDGAAGYWEVVVVNIANRELIGWPWYRILKAVLQIPTIIVAISVSDAEVHKLCVLISVVVDAVRLPRAAWNHSSSLQSRRVTIVRVLRGVIEDDIHFLAVIVKMVSNTGLGW